MKLSKIIFSIFIVFQLIGEELDFMPSKTDFSGCFDREIEHKKRFFYGSFSPVPGGGISIRDRHSATGTALDIKLGVAGVSVFDTVEMMPILSGDFNWFKFFRKNEETSTYVSYGVGAAYIIPYIPLRTGIEFKNGFIDIGAKMLLGILPLPEVRGGINF